MSTQTLSPYAFVSELPAAAEITFHDVSWEEYEELLEEVGEASGLRISYDEGTLNVMTLSAKHEYYERFLEKMLGFVSVRLGINVRSFGSATMRKKKKRKGNEPDLCFYVQSGDLIGNRIDLDFENDPPPDVAVEIDIHHDTRKKFSIYAGLDVPELWRFHGGVLTIYLLDEENYREVEAGRALPMLTAQVLTRFLAQLEDDGDFKTLIAFDEWLQTQRS